MFPYQYVYYEQYGLLNCDDITLFEITSDKEKLYDYYKTNRLTNRSSKTIYECKLRTYRINMYVF